MLYSSRKKARIEVRVSSVLNDPVMIVGVPRSGTTMLYNILSRHKVFRGSYQIPWIAETSIFGEYIRYTNEQFNSRDWPDWYEYFAGNKNQFTEFQKESIRSFLQNATIARGAQRILEKTPNHLDRLDLIYETFPDVRVINIIRHPVDVLASMRKRSRITPGKEGDWLRVSVEDFARGYIQKIANVEHYADEHAILTIRYEDLTKDPLEQLKVIFKFLNIEFDPTVIAGTEPKKGAGVFPYRSNVPVPNSGDWQGVVSKQEMDIIQLICRKCLATYDYIDYKSSK